MKKTINISLNGIHFNMNEDAYNHLDRYLQSLKSSMSEENGIDEIIEDIEARIAEIFSDRLSTLRDVINKEDVNDVINKLGTVEQLFDTDETNNNSTASYYQKKKLYRDKDNKILGGVLAGISHYFGWDTTITRLVYIFIFIFPVLEIVFLGSLSGIAFVGYFILWIILPKAITHSEKMEMYGKTVTLGTIRDNIANSKFTTESSKAIDDFREKHGSNIDRIMRGAVKIILIIIGMKLILVGISILFGILVLFTTLIKNNLLNVGSLFFSYDWHYYLFIGFLLTSLSILCLWFILGGVRIITDRLKNLSLKHLLISLLVLILCLMGMVFIGIYSMANINESISENKKIEVPTIEKDTMNVIYSKINDSNIYYLNRQISMGPVKGKTRDGKHFLVEIDNNMSINKSLDDKVYVEIEYKSKSKNSDFLKDIKYNYKINGDKIIFDKYLYIPVSSKYKYQDVRIKLFVPENKVVKTRNFYKIYNEDKTSRFYNYSKKELVFNIKNNELKCENCDSQDNDKFIDITELEDEDFEDFEEIKFDNKNINIKIKKKKRVED